jgi:tRNA (guanosine-2'-O-)-methyltransferase
MADRDLIEFLSGFVTEERNSAFIRVLENRTRYISIVLEDIYQSHNASAVLRTCDCYGIQDIHIIERRNEYKVSKGVALGSDKWLSLYRNQGENVKTIEIYSTLREKGYRVVATTPHENGVTVDNFDLSKGKIALVFGTELKGLTKEAIAEADEYIKIPMFGFTESFNVSVSAAIILHSLIGKLHKSDINWRLEGEEIDEIRLEWLKMSIKNSSLLVSKYYLMKS